MRLVRAGPLTIRDIEDDVLTEKEHLSAKPKTLEAGVAARLLYGCRDRQRAPGGLKTYELMTRQFGWDKLPKPASAKDITAYLLDRALRSQGVVSLNSVCHLDAPRKPAVAALIASRVRRGELMLLSPSPVPASRSTGRCLLRSSRASARRRISFTSSRRSIR